nr:hypothetical protein [Tanacetum cinerariifolium]
MYASGRVDIFDMADIDLFTVVALNMMVLKLGYTGKYEPMFYNYLRSLTSLDKGLHALAWEEDVRCLATLVRSFNLIEVYIEHGVTTLDSYLRAPLIMVTLEDITDEPSSITANRTKKILLLTWHEYSETTKELVCDSVTPSSLTQHDSSTPCKDFVCESITPRCMPDCILTHPINESVITYTRLSGIQGVDIQSHVILTIQSQFSDINLSFVSQQATNSKVINDVMRQLSFDETKLDGEAGFANVAGSGMNSSGLSHDESFRVDKLDLDLNLNELVNLNVSQVKTQSELPVSEEPDVGRTQKPILAEVSTQEPIMAEVITEVPIVEEVGTQEFSVKDVVLEDYVSSWEDAEQGNGQEDESAPTDRHEDAGTYDDDVDKYFLVDEENEIIEPDVDVHLFGNSMDLSFDNIGVTNLVSNDVLEREDVDVINADGFNSDPANDEEKNYRKRWLAELRTEMEGVLNASGQWKYSFYTGKKFTTPKEAKGRVYLHSIESRRNLKLYKNDGVRIRARCNRKVHVFTMSQEDSIITYTKVSSSFEGLSDIGSPGLDGLPMMPEDLYAYVVAAFQAPPLSDYMLGLEEPEHAPPLLDFVSEFVYLEFMPSKDDVFLAEDQPLPAAVSPTIDSPGYIADSDPEENPTDYPADGEDDDDGSFDDDEDDNDNDVEEATKEHPALADSIPPPPVHHTTARISIPVQAPTPFWSEAQIDRILSIPSPPPSPLFLWSSPLPHIPSPPLPISPPLLVSSLPLPTSPTYPLGYRTAMIRLRAEAPSIFHPLSSSTPPSGTPPLLPIPLPTSSPPLLLPSTSHRADVPEVTLPPQKRLCIALGPRYKVGKSSSDPTARSTRGFRVDYGFVATLDDEIRHDPERDLNMLRRDRRAHARTARLMESEVRISREAWVESMDASDTARTEKMAPKRTTRSTPATTATTATTMTDAQLKALIDQGVANALAVRDADRSQNGKDSHDSGMGARRQAPHTRECTYQDFMK